MLSSARRGTSIHPSNRVRMHAFHYAFSERGQPLPEASRITHLHSRGEYTASAVQIKYL